MKPERVIMFVAALAIAGCGRQPTRQLLSNTASKQVAAPDEPPPPPATARDPRTPLPEPKGGIDLKSVEAAGQVVQQFGALVEQGRALEAASLWSNEQPAAAFIKQLRPHTHLEMGSLQATEGAAGSVYTTIPVVFYGNGFKRPASVILRRVNDVPGSTGQQRRWHIERIDWGTSP